VGFQLLNQQAQTFYSTDPNLPLIDPSVDNQGYDNQLKAHAFETLVRPLYTQKRQGTDVVIQDDNTNSPVDAQTFTEAFVHYLKTDVIDQELTQEFRSIYDEGSQHDLSNTLSFDQFLLSESLSDEGLPYPESGRVIYTPGEVKESAKDLYDVMDQINQQSLPSKHQAWFSRLGAYISQYKLSNFRLVTMKDDKAFDDLKRRMTAYMKHSNQLPANTVSHLTQFNQLSLEDELSIGMFLPDELNHDPNGFNRLLEYELAQMERQKNPLVFNEMYSLKGLFQPTKILLLNLSEYTNATDLHGEWKSIVQAFNKAHRLRHIKNNKLQTVRSVSRENTVTPTYDGGNRMLDQSALRSDNVSYLTKKPISTKELIRRVRTIMKKQVLNQPTSNVTKQKRKTFMRANRRKPFDLTARGKGKRKQYYPDLHIWLDTSGSISQDDYQNQLYVMIGIAKKLNVDIYMNSFSHIVSETTHIRTKHQSAKNIFKAIENIDKVAGGTDFINVWKAIDQTEKANVKRNEARRTHLILSDMDYHIPHSYTLQMNRPSVKNTYYIPIRIQTTRSRSYIDHFAESLRERGGPATPLKHILY